MRPGSGNAVQPLEREGRQPCHTVMASLSIAAAVLVILAAYAQVRIPRFTAGHASAMLSRAVLAATGIALGSVSAAIYYPDVSRALLVFLIGFGVVHFPAALILFFKGARHSGRS